MKATFQIPDELYRAVKARVALEGRSVREVVIALFESWLGRDSETPPGDHDSARWQSFQPPLRDLAKNVESHDMESIRESIAAHSDEPI